MCYHVKFNTSVITGVRINTERNPKIGDRWDLTLLGSGVADPLKTSLSHLCYHVRFDSSASKGVCINKQEPPKLGNDGAPPLAEKALLTVVECIGIDARIVARRNLVIDVAWGRSQANQLANNGTSVLLCIIYTICR